MLQFQISGVVSNSKVKKFYTKFSISFPSSIAIEKTRSALEIYIRFGLVIKALTTFFAIHWKIKPRLTNHLRSESERATNPNRSCQSQVQKIKFTGVKIILAFVKIKRENNNSHYHPSKTDARPFFIIFLKKLYRKGNSSLENCKLIEINFGKGEFKKKKKCIKRAEQYYPNRGF
ncbi:hypothetical protein AGLY_007125 [Aphis glycines]|uniref:Uncharacterized protein n=1 Tax=Aphis glycines TaxID=307491 RepID=A0A6G0TNP5_APHGL|nr:hypothetical protein AGLY_007125 [Aphis glycines]